MMKIEKHPIQPDRIRQIQGSFAFIEHKFLRNGFWTSLDHRELLLYLFLIMAADRQGVSYYSYNKICTILRITLDQYITARCQRRCPPHPSPPEFLVHHIVIN